MFAIKQATKKKKKKNSVNLTKVTNEQYYKFLAKLIYERYSLKTENNSRKEQHHPLIHKGALSLTCWEQ